METDRRWIRDALRRNGGSWEAWAKRLQPFRDSVNARLRESPEKRLARGNASLFAEVSVGAGNERWDAIGVLSRLKAFQADLRRRGIDLIVLPVPPREALACRAFSDQAPADGIVLPRYLRFTLQLLDSDIEAVNLTRGLLESGAKGEFPFYYNFACDHHRADRGRIVGARMAARRLRRYGFVPYFPASAVKVAVVNGMRDADGGCDLEFARGREYPVRQVTIGGEFGRFDLSPDAGEEVRRSPVIVIGDSMLAEPGARTYGAAFAGYLAWQARIVPAVVSHYMGIHHDPVDVIMSRLSKAPGMPGLPDGRRALVFVFFLV